MCGIAAIIHPQSTCDPTQLRSMCDALQRRGPDAAGYWVRGGIGLGHRRLSIIDLHTGGQPMLDAEERVALVFNGEIYNFKELRAELQAKGCQFRTTSDTEVIIHGYLTYGMEALLPRLEGMFALVLHDLQAQVTWVARDKFGEKPLYYTQQNGGFLFASELKALMPQVPQRIIDRVALNQFLALTYIPAPRTIWCEIKKFPAANCWCINHRGEGNIRPYYNLIENLRQRPPITDFEAAKQQLYALLDESVAQRMVSDVPLGAFLSGGLDSSIVSALMARHSTQPIHTFSIGFIEKEYDESERAKLVADHIKADHTVRFLDYRDVVQNVEDIIAHFDEPYGDSSAIPSYYVAKLARERVTVVLTGDCADELFGGYEKYLGGWYAERFKRLPKWLQTTVRAGINALPHTQWTNSLLRRAKKVLQAAAETGFDAHYRYMCLGFDDTSRASLLATDWYADVRGDIQQQYDAFSADNPLEKSFYTDVCTVLEGDMLVKVDRMGMKNSLEARVPFLDSRIVETAFSMPTEFKIKGRDKKHILKKTFAQLLPTATPDMRKKGFGVPVDYWFKNQLKPELIELFDREKIEKQGIFNPDVIDQLLREHWSGKQNHKGKLWNLYVFQKWFNQNNQL
jgi:asparagine synthase (glutamine-hydrolysing)